MTIFMDQQSKFSKKDLIVALVIGEIAAWLLLVLAKFIFPGQAYLNYSQYLKYLPFVFPVVCALCLFVAFILAKKIAVIYQIAKFVLIGGFNFLIDSGVVAILTLSVRNLYHIDQDAPFMTIFSLTLAFFALYKGISFIIASTNSYFWNKLWTFKREKTEKSSKEFLQFFIVSVVGFLINVGIAYGVFDIVSAPEGLNKDQWTMLAVVAATVVSMCWNFIGYKFIVFEQKKPSEPAPARPQSPANPPDAPKKIV
jgi:putative flippase GtrA